MRQMTWEDWNPYRGVNPRDIAVFLVICLFVSLAYEAVGWVRWRRTGDPGKTVKTQNLGRGRQKGRGFWIGFTLFYGYTILCATILGRADGRSPELRARLFWTLEAALETGDWIYWYYLVGNIALFIPMGIALMHLFVSRTRVEKKHRKRDGNRSCGYSFLCTVGLCFLLSAVIEGIQYVTGTGLCEADDLLHNTLGGAIGSGGDWVITLGVAKLHSVKYY